MAHEIIVFSGNGILVCGSPVYLLEITNKYFMLNTDKKNPKQEEPIVVVS